MENFRNTFIRSILAVVACVVVVSCSNDNEYTGPVPDMKTIECNAGDRPSFTFTAGGDWQLFSDAVWCRLITSSGEMQSMAGIAGMHTITLRITDEEIRNEPTEAHISIRMGSREAIIVKVVRGADQLYMRLYDITDTPIYAIKIGYIDYVPFLVEANFRFSAVEYPEWVEFYGGELSGVPGEQTESMARIVTDGVRERYPITKEDGYVVTFADASGNHVFSFPIIFDGMHKDEIAVQRPAKNYYGWSVAADGKSFVYDNGDGTQQRFEEELSYMVTAREDDYEIVMYEHPSGNDNAYYEDGVSWIHFDKQRMTLSVDAAQEAREGMVMALPRGVYNKVRADIIGNIFKRDAENDAYYTREVRDDFLQYILIEFSQEGAAIE